MTDELPNIEKIGVEGPPTLHLKFRGRKWRVVNLAGLIAREEFLAPLRYGRCFGKAKVIDWGAGVGWPDDRDLSASTLWRMSEEQMPFANSDFIAWQVHVGLSNQEAAHTPVFSVRTIKNFHAGTVAVSNAVAIACRAMESDPTRVAGHYEPRRTVRPRAA